MKRLMKMYERLYASFGPQGWWPGRTPFEVAVGAILTQNTSWRNVERAISNLREAGALAAVAIHRMPLARLSGLIRPSGYYNVKAVRLKEFVGFLTERHGGSLKRMGRGETGAIREDLLGIKGIGPETADSIMLYALGKPVFVIDAYTRRVLSRHGLARHEEPYDTLQGLFHENLDADVVIFNEYHALLVMVGKTFCRPSRALCDKCPISGV